MSNPKTDSDGTKRWYNDQGQLHRIDGHAVEWASGTKQWWVNDKLHRVDGPAVECTDGSKQWWVDDKRHRIDGPAVEYADGYKEWWVDGKLHRVDGPAVECADGNKEWYIDGIRYDNEEEYWNKIKVLGLLQVDRQQRVSRFKRLEII